MGLEKEESFLLEKGLSTFYIQYYPRFLKVALRYVRDRGTAEDIVADSFLAFWDARDRVSQNVNIPAYIATIVRNRCLNYLESMQIHTRIEEGIKDDGRRRMEADIHSLRSSEPSDIFLSEVQRITIRTIASLPPRVRTVFRLSRYQNKSYKEIASACNMTERQVAADIQKALARLRETLSDYLPQK